MITRLTKVVLPFYHFSNKSYKVNKLAGRRYKNTLKLKQTTWKQLHKLHQQLEFLAGSLTKFNLTFLENHTNS
jgi:hypothetical protein